MAKQAESNSMTKGICNFCKSEVDKAKMTQHLSAYCNKCARRSEDEEMLLPVVNSPRVGVCAYTG